MNFQRTDKIYNVLLSSPHIKTNDILNFSVYGYENPFINDTEILLAYIILMIQDECTKFFPELDVYKFFKVMYNELNEEILSNLSIKTTGHIAEYLHLNRSNIVMRERSPSRYRTKSRMIEYSRRSSESSKESHSCNGMCSEDSSAGRNMQVMEEEFKNLLLENFVLYNETDPDRIMHNFAMTKHNYKFQNEIAGLLKKVVHVEYAMIGEMIKKPCIKVYFNDGNFKIIPLPQGVLNGVADYNSDGYGLGTSILNSSSPDSSTTLSSSLPVLSELHFGELSSKYMAEPRVTQDSVESTKALLDYYISHYQEYFK